MTSPNGHVLSIDMTLVRRTLYAWANVALLLACGSAGYTVDSPSSACRQRPDYCALVTGEEASVPAARGGAELASIQATLRVLTAVMKSRIEHELVECADWANAEVNRRHLGGQSPSRQQCQQVLFGRDPCGRTVTRAMQLGTEKHDLALQCVQERLGKLIPGSFSLQQRYRYDARTARKELVDPEETKALLQKGCSDELVGTLVPDVVIHSGNPLEALAIYDFKFTCPSSNYPRWTTYPEGHPYANERQGSMYKKLLAIGPDLVAPAWGIIRWVESQL